LVSPEETIQKVSACGIEFASFADHESIGSYFSVIDSVPENLHLYPAVEFSTYYKNNEIHFLAYFAKGVTEQVKQFLAKRQEERVNRAKIAVVNLRNAGVRISYEDIMRFATGECVSRAHIGRSLVACGAAANQHDAFLRYLAYEKGLVPPPFISPEKLFQFLSENGAVIIWAHPEIDTFDMYLSEFVDAGLSGVEICSKRKQETFTFYFERTAASFGLVLTYGSDWHGFQSEVLAPIEAPKSHVEKFLSLMETGK
jgi:hypothetical protein